MKKLKLMIVMAGALVGTATLNAQSLYDTNRLMGSDLNGTARFVGMGGAMGALGGDISTMGTNPAGIGIYRGNDAMVSFGFSNLGSKSAFGNSTTNVDKFRGSFDNAGFVFASKIGNQTALRFVNFGFNYHKVKSFDKNMAMSGVFGASQTEEFANLLNDNSAAYGGFMTPDMLMDKGAYTDPEIPWLGALAYESNLVRAVKDADGSEYYLPYFLPDNKVNGMYSSKESGGLHEYDFNVAFNFYDRFYVGATVGVYSVDYTRNSTYSEGFIHPDGQSEGGYQLRNNYRLDGSGVDFKVGFILRPFENSPLRIGGAIHTPTYYNLREYQMAFLDYDTFSEEEDKFIAGTAFPQNSNGGEMESDTEYNMVTPWKFNLSLGYTIGKNVALGAEYEYSDYSAAKVKYDDGVTNDFETDGVKAYLKGVNTLRLGAEIKLAPEFAFRVGYNHITASIDTDAYKALSLNSVRTDTEYSNGKAVNNYTLGFGYRGSMFYADMAYQYNTYKEDFYAFNVETLPATQITNNNHKVVFTLGMRF